MNTTEFLRSFLKAPSLPQDADPTTKAQIIADKIKHWYTIYRNPEALCGPQPNKFEVRHYQRNARQNLRRLHGKYPEIVERIIRESEVKQ